MLAHVADGRMKAPAEADGQHYAGAFGCRDCRARARAVERDRLFDEDVLARRCGIHGLPRVLSMRRRQHDCIHSGIAQNIVVTLNKGDVVIAAELLRGRGRARVGEDELDLIAFALNRAHEGASPAAKPDYGCADHDALGAIIGART